MQEHQALLYVMFSFSVALLAFFVELFFRHHVVRRYTTYVTDFVMLIACLTLAVLWWDAEASATIARQCGWYLYVLCRQSEPGEPKWTALLLLISLVPFIYMADDCNDNKLCHIVAVFHARTLNGFTLATLLLWVRYRLKTPQSYVLYCLFLVLQYVAFVAVVVIWADTESLLLAGVFSGLAGVYFMYANIMRLTEHF